MTDESSQWMELLRELFGDRAEEALEEMRHMGMDPEQFASAAGMSGMPGMVEHVISQLRALMSQSAGEDVNWTLAHDVARGVAAEGGDPTVTAAQATELRGAVSRAELWLDAATDFAPATLTPHVWSHAEWVEATLPTWRHLAGPVAVSVSRALADMLGDEGAGTIIEQISPTVCGMHLGQAAGALAREAFGGTDLGVLLVPEPRVVLVPRAIAAFADGLDVPLDEVTNFLALRECAHVRLFKNAPWLVGQLHNAIERYAQGVTIDPRALDEAVSQVGMTDPASIQKALTRGIFASSHSPEQQATLASIEATLALIEGWVTVVATAAGAPHLPHLGALSEMMVRRRAAGGPAEETFATLLGLDLRPRRLRDATQMWSALTHTSGASGRDEVWAHPDLVPDAEALADWQGWLDSRADGRQDDVDRELERLLDDDSPEPESGT